MDEDRALMRKVGRRDEERTLVRTVDPRAEDRALMRKVGRRDEERTLVRTVDPRAEDRALMRRVRRRDEEALTALVGRYAPKMLGVARRLIGPADAEDAVQRAFVQAYLGAGSYRERWAVSTWLYRILTNVCVDELRRRSVRARHRTAAQAEAPPAERPDVAARLDLERALGVVPREARVLLALRYVDGLSHAELARIRGISVNTVKSQLARGKVILRRALDAGGAR